jgi:flavin-dependent dehydrogenase
MYDVIVVGARAAGASTAMLLARHGMQVLAIDRATFPSDAISTHQLQVPGVARLRRWGLLDQVAASTPATRRIQLDLGGIVLQGCFPRYEGESTMYSPRRTVLDSLLVDAARAAGAEVRERFWAEELVWGNGQVVGIRGRHGAAATMTETARIVVGADGKHSMVAQAVRAPQYRHCDAMTVACYSYWSGVPLTRGELYQRPGCAAAAFPTNDDLTIVYVAVPITEFSSFRTDIERAYLQTLDRCGDLGERVRSGRRVERIRTTPDLPNYVRVPYGPGWALTGDAGLVIDPVTAQGIGNAFADAERLANAIIESFDGTAALATCLAEYQRQRDAATLSMYDFTIALATLMPDARLELLLQALAARQEEIDRLLGVFAGIIPVSTYFSARNFVRILGFRDARRALSAAIRARKGSESIHGRGHKRSSVTPIRVTEVCAGLRAASVTRWH